MFVWIQQNAAQSVFLRLFEFLLFICRFPRHLTHHSMQYLNADYMTIYLTASASIAPVCGNHSPIQV